MVVFVSLVPATGGEERSLSVKHKAGLDPSCFCEYTAPFPVACAKGMRPLEPETCSSCEDTACSSLLY